MISPKPVVLERDRVRLEPLGAEHVAGLRAAAADGALWELWYTVVPAPDETEAWVAEALKTHDRLAWAVRDLATDEIVGSTSYHDIQPAIDRVEIGHTWYARSRQRSHVNTTCKLLLLSHAFDALGCKVVGLRTDNFNFASQKAIAALGAKLDGVIRHHKLRRDGSVRDTHMFSILAGEWPDVRRNLEFRLTRHAG